MPMSRRLLLLSGVGSLANVGLIWGVDRYRQGNLTGSRGTDATDSVIALTAATVEIRGFQYDPPEVTLKRGGIVTFHNFDSTPHTATPVAGSQFTGTGRLRRGEMKAIVFEQVGIQEYFCDVHPSMTGRIVVVE
jgi:plastocyanin